MFLKILRQTGVDTLSIDTTFTPKVITQAMIITSLPYLKSATANIFLTQKWLLATPCRDHTVNLAHLF
jgi:hypothetical protein